MKNNGVMVFFDTETTGFRQPVHIVEIGAIKYDLDKREWIGAFHAYVRPPVPITPEAFKVHRISDAELVYAMDGKHVTKQFMEFVGDLPLCGHNVKQYDWPLVRQYLDKEYLPDIYDTLEFAKKQWPHLKKHNLGILCKTFGLEHHDAHSAYGDVKATIALYNKLLEEQNSDPGLF